MPVYNFAVRSFSLPFELIGTRQITNTPRTQMFLSYLSACGLYTDRYSFSFATLLKLWVLHDNVSNEPWSLLCLGDSTLGRLDRVLWPPKRQLRGRGADGTRSLALVLVPPKRVQEGQGRI